MSTAFTYHQLGIVAQRRELLDDAENWYRKALAITEDLGDHPSTAMSYGQLGLLAEDRRLPQEALIWVVRCVALFDHFPHPMTGPGPSHLKRLTQSLGIGALEQAWQSVTGNPPPAPVRHYVLADDSST